VARRVEGGIEEEPARLDAVIRAAGGIVWRQQNGSCQVLLVHRPKYDDWSFPKGKAEEGEEDLACALREVWEETGLTCDPQDEVGSAFYRDGRGRQKVVRYWAMQPRAGAFVPGDEVDEVAWLGLAAAGSRLSYDHDRDILSGWKREDAGS
jgi:8-oxo-dGTP pyrophosphatase MutT (NUDIX family)